MDERLHRRRGAGLSFLMGGDGEPLLLLHGVPGSSQTWQKVGIKVASRFRVIIPDLMGFGASDPPAGDEFFLEEQAKSVRGLINYLQIKRLYLGGHDFGAAVAVTLMRLYPEVDVRGLILSAANLFTDTRIPFPMAMARLPLLNPFFAWSMAGNRLGLRLLYESAAYNKEEAHWRDFRRHLTGGSIKLTRRIFQRSMADFEAYYAGLEAALPSITCPTLVLWGDEDPFLTVHVGERVRAALPDAMLKVYAYTGHFVPEERPIESAEDIVLRFTDVPLVIKT
jgi:pimeloyl-ACP methyl ester carboxylesterase